MNHCKQVRQGRQQAIRAYCANTYTLEFGKNKESKEKPLTVKIVSLASIVLPAERELNTVGPNQ